MARSTLDEAICPACGSKGLEYSAEPIDLPYLGESLESMVRCLQCGYRHADFALTTINEPTRVSYRITAEADMSVRVVRSSSGTIRFPELGILIEPGVASEAFISNVEGILVRVERVLGQLRRDTQDETARQRIQELQDTLDAMRLGKAEPVTLILEDPFGNSSILAEKAVLETIPPEQAKDLKTGMPVFEQGEEE